MNSVLAYYPVVKSLSPDSYKEMIIGVEFWCNAVLLLCLGSEFLYNENDRFMKYGSQVKEQSEPGYEFMEFVSLKDCK